MLKRPTNSLVTSGIPRVQRSIGALTDPQKLSVISQQGRYYIDESAEKIAKPSGQA